LYEEYLGITPDSDTNGILQDIHWSAGLFGYFPTYAIGNLISAQLKSAIERDLGSIEQIISQQKFGELVSWLDTHIYRYGKKLTPEKLVQKATGEDLSANYFLSYLKEKYEKILNS
jgi:carboxypeptidase Taq